MRNLYLVIFFVLFAGLAIGQKKYIRCYSDELLQEEIKKNPERGKSLDAMNRKVDELIASRSPNMQAGKPGGGGGGSTRTTTVYIPVVVNVVYKTTTENISDKQIESQIAVLNKDYGATNFEVLNSYSVVGGSGIVANFKVQFCLYKVVRKLTTVTSFTNDAVKKTSSGGQDPINPTTMLNIWVCNLGGGLLGYATFPGGSSSVDGVVNSYSAFGTKAAGASADPYDEGRTATHEIGHWLGLYHTFQGGCSKNNDGVGDTPPVKTATYGCPGANYPSGCGSGIAQTMNYMDYTEDLCMYMFTKGQLARVDGFISTSRAAYCLAACPTPAPAIVQQSRISLQTPNQEMLVYPTITRNMATIAINANTAGKGEMILLSQSGTILKRQALTISKSINNYRLFVADLPNGLYTVKVTVANGAIETRKLIVQH